MLSTLEQPQPVDRNWSLYWCFYLLGFGALTPWSALVSSVDYFEDVYPNWAPIRWITFLCFGTSTFCLALQLWKPSLCGNEFHILLGFILFASLLLLIPILEWILVGEGDGTKLSFGLLLASTAVIGVVGAIVEGAVLGVTLTLPEQYPQVTNDLKIQRTACVSGGGSSGFFVSLLRLLTKASFSNSRNALRVSAFTFFWIASLICLICVLCCWMFVISHPLIIYCKFQTQTNYVGEAPLLSHHPRSSLSVHVIKKLTRSILLLLLIFTVSFAIYPGVTEDVECDVLGDWYSVTLVVVFTFFDVVGKSIPSKFTGVTFKWMTYGAGLRVLFLPVVALVVTQFPNPILLSLLLALTAASGGMLNVAVFIAGQELLVNYHESLIGGTALLLSVFLGQELGSGISLLWAKFN